MEPNVKLEIIKLVKETIEYSHKPEVGKASIVRTQQVQNVKEKKKTKLNFDENTNFLFCEGHDEESTKADHRGSERKYLQLMCQKRDLNSE